jgi:hypothetical protein
MCAASGPPVLMIVIVMKECSANARLFDYNILYFGYTPLDTICTVTVEYLYTCIRTCRSKSKSKSVKLLYLLIFGHSCYYLCEFEL